MPTHALQPNISLDDLDGLLDWDPNYPFHDPAPFPDPDGGYVESRHSSESASPLMPLNCSSSSTVPDGNGSPLSTGSPYSTQSPSATAEETRTANEGSEEKKSPKRKRANRYKNAPPSVLSRRRAQNRASQRAYRERKDQRIRDLEAMLADAKDRNDALSQAYCALQDECHRLRTTGGEDRPRPPLAALMPASYHHLLLQQPQQQHQHHQHHHPSDYQSLQSCSPALGSPYGDISGVASPVSAGASGGDPIYMVMGTVPDGHGGYSFLHNQQQPSNYSV